MRMESVSDAKWERASHRLVPSEGTRLRALYDLLKANRAIPIRIEIYAMRGSLGPALDQLRNFYGLDIRTVPGNRRGYKGSGGTLPAKYVLAGEWFGRTYVDYIADHVAAFDRKRAV